MNIIQIGCNDGNDHVFNFVKDTSFSRLVLIDANEKCIFAAKEQYKNIPNVEFIHKAITDSNEDYVDLYIPYENEIAAQSSLVHFHLANHSCHDVRVERVPAITINKLFTDLKMACIDRLYIDIEGLDVDIVNQIDFSLIDIKFLMFEYIHSDGTMSRGGPKLDFCKARLQDFGYTMYEEEFNIIAQK